MGRLGRRRAKGVVCRGRLGGAVGSKPNPFGILVGGNRGGGGGGQADATDRVVGVTAWGVKT